MRDQNTINATHINLPALIASFKFSIDACRSGWKEDWGDSVTRMGSMINQNMYLIDHFSLFAILDDSYIPFPLLANMLVSLLVSILCARIVYTTKDIFLIPFVFDSRYIRGIDSSGE